MQIYNKPLFTGFNANSGQNSKINNIANKILFKCKLDSFSKNKLQLQHRPNSQYLESNFKNTVVIKRNKLKNLVLLNIPSSFARLPSCLFEHVIKQQNFTLAEQIYYLYVAGSKNNQIKLSIKKQAKMLNMSVTTIKRCQKGLQAKRSLKITVTRSCNIVQATMPHQVFEKLDEESPIRNGWMKDKIINRNGESYISHLQNTKLFFDVNVKALRSLFYQSDTLSFALIFWYLSYLSYKNKTESFFVTAQEIMDAVKIAKPTLYKNMKLFEQKGFIKKEEHGVGIWQITLTKSKSILQKDVKCYPQKDEKNFVLSKKNELPSGKKMSLPYISINNKNINNKVGKEEIVDKSKDFPTITTNDFCFLGFKEEEQKIYQEKNKANNSNQVKKPSELTPKQKHDLELLKEEMKKEGLYQESKSPQPSKQENKSQNFNKSQDSKETYCFSKEQMQIVKDAFLYLNEKHEGKKVTKTTLQTQLRLYIDQKLYKNKQKPTLQGNVISKPSIFVFKI